MYIGHIIFSEISITGTRVVEKGNSIYLTCNASGTTSPPDGIDWYKDGMIVKTHNTFCY